MQSINETRLETDLDYRVAYLAEFMGFSDADVQSLQAAAPLLAPLVPQLVDAVYVKLFSYDATKRHFIPRQSGYEGAVPAELSALDLNHEMIEFRKKHLSGYLVKLVTQPFDSRMNRYLDRVGSMHTPKSGSAELDVPLVQMNALLGFVADALTQTLFSLNLDRETETRTIRAFQKLLWLQNDLINRHY